jgi:hypothetical protein
MIYHLGKHSVLPGPKQLKAEIRLQEDLPGEAKHIKPISKVMIHGKNMFLVVNKDQLTSNKSLLMFDRKKFH